MQDKNPTGTSSISAVELARPVNLPPRPALLIALQHELARDEPHLKKIGSLVHRDAAITGNLLAIANSASFNLRRHVDNIEDAINLIGLNNCAAIITRLVARRALTTGKRMMPRFWDVSEKRSRGMMYLARTTRTARTDFAYHLGLFSDIGIPLMMASFDGYGETIAMANRMEGSGFLELENERHRINHAQIGAMLAEHWHTDPLVVQTIKQHHAHEILKDDSCPETVRSLIALFFLVDRAIQEHRNEKSVEWSEGGESAIATLGLNEVEANTLCEELKVQFLKPGLS